jgi:hypothetical protein
MSRDPSQRDEFQAMVIPLQRGFEARAAHDEQERLATLVRASADLDFPHGPPFDVNAFDQAFDWARALR